MSNVVLNPQTPATRKEFIAFASKNKEYLKELKTDVRVIRDEYGELAALVPRFHATFKDGSDLMWELSSGETFH